ncbi:MAG: pilus assembly protein PilP [Pseudomonadota bacterium]
MSKNNFIPGRDVAEKLSILPKVLSTALVLFALQACQDTEMRDLKEFVATAYQDRKPEIEPLPEIPPYQKYEYAAAEEDDPFDAENIVTSRADGNVVAGDNPDKNRRREELEKFPLDALKMVGTMIKEQQPWVIVRTSEGTAHRATIGNYMGQNEGKIKEIIPEEQKVLLAELVIDTAGRWVTREVEITIDE